MLKLKTTSFAIISIAVLMYGCVSSQQAPQREVVEAPLPPGASTIKLNVHAGYYQEFKTDFDKTTWQKIEMVMHERNLHKKWAPTQVICISRKLPAIRFALRLLQQMLLIQGSLG